MKAIKRKLILMILSFTIILMTALATTFAWVGIFTYASTSEFDLNLKVVDLAADYFLTISSTGDVGTFGESVETIDLKRQILRNMDYDLSNLSSDEAIDILYSRVANELNPVTTLVDSNNKFEKFKTLSSEIQHASHYNRVTQKYTPGYIDGDRAYLCFDLYLSVNTKEGISSTSEINAPVFLTELEETIIGNLSSHTVLMYDSNTEHDFRVIDYSEDTSDLGNYLPILTDIANSRVININSKNVVRIGFEVYEPIAIDDEYDDTNNVVSNYIYYGGSNTPSYDEESNSYDLGNILPTNYNTAVLELMNTKSYLDVDVPNEYVSRKDLALNFDNSQIWKVATDLSSPSNYLGVHNGVQTKMKLRTYLWFEGWDADCLLGINNTDVTFNLTFTASLEE